MPRLISLKRFFYLLLFGGLALFFYPRFVKMPAEDFLSPTNTEPTKRQRAENYFPFRSLLGFSDKQPRSGEVLGTQDPSPPAAGPNERRGLLDRLVGTFSDTSRTVPTSPPTPASNWTENSLTSSPSPLPVTAAVTPPVTSVVLSGDQQAVVMQTSVVTKALTLNDYNALYNLLDADFRAAYTYDEFVNSLQRGTHVASADIQSTPRIFGPNNEWAEVTIYLTQSNGNTKRFTAIFHKANNLWTLFGTAEAT